MMDNIFHIAEKKIWDIAQTKGYYFPISLENEGFIHCSKKSQVLRVANKYYYDKQKLVLLEINLIKIEPEVKWEPGADAPDELFPHIYGKLNITAVEKVEDFHQNESGIFVLQI